MVELTASIELNKWLSEKELRESSFVHFIGHKENDSVYGALFTTEKGLVFQRHKWGKSCIIYTCKMVDRTIYNSFIALDNGEYLSREVSDMKK